MAPLPPVEPPPLSMTSIPTNARPTPAEPVKPPVLASEMLREEVAPMAPGQIMLRVWLGTFAVAFALAALTYSLGYGPHYRGVFAGSLATAVVATFSAIVSACSKLND